MHRPGYLDYIGVKRFDQSGAVIGEQRFIGLYTSSAYSANPADIPILRQKIAAVMAQAGFAKNGHLSKNLLTVLETYPRDELFQISEQELFATAIAIQRLGDRQRTRVFVRRDVYGRFYSCLVYVPRDRFTTELRLKIQQILLRAFAGTSVEFTPYLSESPLARIFLLVRTKPTGSSNYDVRVIEAQIVAAMRRWEDDLQLAIDGALGEEAGKRIGRAYAGAFPVAYREEVSTPVALHDLAILERLSPEEPLGLSLYRPLESPVDTLRFRLFHLARPIPLSGSLPMLEHMGVKVLDEKSYAIEPAGKPALYIHDFGMAHGVDSLSIETIKALFEDAFAKVWRGEIESDDFNRLVLGSGMAAGEITVLRAYCKYLKQTGFTFSQAYIEQTLAAHPEIARKLADLFEARFDPAATEVAQRQSAAASCVASSLLSKPRYAPIFISSGPTASASRGSPSSSIPGWFRSCPSPGRCSRYSSTRRGWRASICAAAKSRAAGCAGPTAWKIFALKCWG